MKKIVIISLSFLFIFTIFASVVLITPSTMLYLLNWGEYIDSELIKDFEKEYKCQVILETVTSSEAMYQKITSNATPYDVAIPGDYMIHQLYREDYLKELDVNNSELTNLNNYKNLIVDDLASLMNKYLVEDNNEFNSYYMPYFWGAYSIIYSYNNNEVESTIKDNGFKCFFNRNLFSSKVKIGMYDTARWIVSCYLMSKDLDPNITSLDLKEENDISSNLKEEIIKALKTTQFDEFGNDSLKRNVANSTLDFCYTQLGDFFDTLSLSFNEGNKINFNVYVPKTTAAFFDGMVIPKTTQNYTLANQFINFMLDENNAYQNATSIGYSPTLKSVVTKFNEASKNDEIYYNNDKTTMTYKEFLTNYPNYLDPIYNCDNVYMLKEKSQAYLTSCETILNSLA